MRGQEYGDHLPIPRPATWTLEMIVSHDGFIGDIPCVGAIVLDPQGRLLMVQRANPPAQGQWSIPGGRVEPGESSLDAIVREVREETNLRVRVIREVGTVTRDAPAGGRYVIRDFLAESVADAPVVAGDDALDARFVHPDDFPHLAVTSGLVQALTDWGILAPR